MSDQSAIIARAYAKVNLALSVGPPLPASAGPQAGFHPIASWFSAIDLFDELELERLGGGAASRFEISWAEDAPRPSPIDWPIEKDLAVRAHRLLEAEVMRPLPVVMRLRKRIPVGGGLGGGSSDAAAMLRAVGALFELAIAPGRLAELSAKLGSDVAFFLDGPARQPPSPAIVSGLGDRIERVARAPAAVLLLLPPFGCPTGAVYRAFDAMPGSVLKDDRVRQLARDSVAAGRIDTRALFNDLAGAAETVAPALAKVRADAEQALETSVHVTGSGSTLFALADSPAQVEHMAGKAVEAGVEAAPVVTGLV